MTDVIEEYPEADVPDVQDDDQDPDEPADLEDYLADDDEGEDDTAEEPVEPEEIPGFDFENPPEFDFSDAEKA